MTHALSAPKVGQDQAVRTITSMTPRREALAIRFAVYCLEQGFLDPRLYPHSLESDAADARSIHFHAYDQAGELAGYVRLVRPDIALRFPMEAHCKLAPMSGRPSPWETMEISRLILRRDLRGGVSSAACQTISAQGRPGTHEAQAVDGGAQLNVLMHLYRSMYRWSCSNNVRFWYAAMERRLARSLAISCLSFKAIGQEIDYYGPVTPYLADLRELEATVASRRPQLYSWMTGEQPMPASHQSLATEGA